jgi:type VI secretion system secreted protein Hcp
MPVYMKIEGIEGMATESNHGKWIEASSLSSPLARRTPDGAYGNDAIQKGSLVFGNIHLSRKVDSSSIPLARQTALGKVYDTVDIHVTTPLVDGEKNLIEYKLSKAILVSHGIDVAHDGTSQSLHETVEINFSKIEWNFKKYKNDGSADGNVTGWYDRPTSKGG